MTKYSFQTLLGLLVFLLGGAPLLTAQTITADIPTTPTCIPSGFLGPSTASPPDGAVYRVGEPVLVESDPYFATLDFCRIDPIESILSVNYVSRSIAQVGVSSVTGQADPTEILHFNVPGTVTITRNAHLATVGLVSTTRNTITIIDDGPRPFPEPVSAPPGEEVPRIEVSSWRGNPPMPVTRSIVTKDNSFSQLIRTRISNSGDAPLVLYGSYHWVGRSHHEVYPRNISFPRVVLPGQTIYIDYGQDFLDYEEYESSYIKFANHIVHSNDPERPYALVAHGIRSVFDTAADIPDDYPYFPPEPPVVRDNFVCNDTNLDGTIDAGDIVTSILRSAP